MSDAFRFLLLRRYARFTLHAWQRWWGRWSFDLLHRFSRWTLWIYGRDNLNPTAGCQIVIEQNGIGRIDSAQGPGFYRALRRGGLAELRKTGASVFHAEMRASHLRLIQHMLRGLATVTELGPAKAGSVELIAVEIVLLPAGGARNEAP